jgi:hypothetical protein
MSVSKDKNEKTGTNQTPTEADVPELLAKAALLLAANQATFEKIISASGYGDATDVIVAKLAQRKLSDVVLISDIRLVSKEGEIARIFGENAMPNALDPGMIGYAHEGFDQLLQTVIIRPLLTAFQAHLSKSIDSDDKSIPRIGHAPDSDDRNVLTDDPFLTK